MKLLSNTKETVDAKSTLAQVMACCRGVNDKITQFNISE